MGETGKCFRNKKKGVYEKCKITHKRIEYLYLFINNMLDFITVQSYTPRPIDCTNCKDHTTAIARCVECVEFLCEQCLAAHKRTKLTKEHDVMMLKDLQSSDVQDQMHRPLYCMNHDREILKYYCETCDDPVCRECLIMEHREHAYGYLKDVNNQQRKKVTASCDILIYQVYIEY